MSKITILVILAAFFTGAAIGQSSLHYNFNNTLVENTLSGPVLTPLSTEGTFVLDTLNEVSGKTKTVYRFDYNCGLQFDNAAAGNFIRQTYTIELYFVFDELTSWKRVVDWKNRKTDNGAYVYYGQLNFYDYVYSTEAPVLPGEYTYYVITRDSATRQLMIYTDAKVEINFIDSYDEGIIDSDHVLNFFYDDLEVPGEATSGAVALLNLYNYALDSTTIKQKYQDLNGQIFGTEDLGGNVLSVRAWPNPATDRLFVSLNALKGGGKIEISLINLLGTVVYTTVASAGTENLRIETSGLPSGPYLLKAKSASGYTIQKLIVNH